MNIDIPNYSLLAQDEDAEEAINNRRKPTFCDAYCWHMLIHIFLFAFSISIAVSGHIGHQEFCPLLNDVLLDGRPQEHIVRFNGTFDRSSPFKGPPTPAVDKAWDDIMPRMLMEIPESVFQRLNASKHSIKTPPTLGQGRLAIFEAVHQIHCVKKLWEASYPDYYPLKKESEFGVWHEHIDHCADMLRQKLMCDADNNLITYNWVHNHYKPHPNFNVQHKCRSYDQLLEAVERHGIPHDRIPETGILRVKGENTVEFEEPPFDPLAE